MLESLFLNGKIIEIVQHLPWVWTFFLLLTRFTTLFTVLPGIGMGRGGLAIRFPVAMALALAAVSSLQPIPVPTDILSLMLALFSEILVGLLIGLIPMMVVSGAQLAGQLSSMTMGLNAGSLMDPTMGTPTAEISRIFGDLMIILFLFIGGHYTVIAVASSTGGLLAPGEFLSQPPTIDLLIGLSTQIFEIGIMIASPVLVALLLTNFVMGLVSKAVPQLNIFIVSFPLTVGIGLVLTAAGLPDIMVYADRVLTQMNATIMSLG